MRRILYRYGISVNLRSGYRDGVACGCDDMSGFVFLTLSSVEYM